MHYYEPHCQRNLESSRKLEWHKKCKEYAVATNSDISKGGENKLPVV